MFPGDQVNRRNKNEKKKKAEKTLCVNRRGSGKWVVLGERYEREEKSASRREREMERIFNAGREDRDHAVSDPE